MDNTFQSDLLDGKWAEQKFAKKAAEIFKATNIKFNNSADTAELRKWDLKYTNQQNQEITFEVKWDKKSSETGNFAIEFFGRSSASGIDATTANYWVILSDNNFYIFNTAKLKAFIKSNPFRSICINNGTAYVYLVPIEQAKAIATKIINL